MCAQGVGTAAAGVCISHKYYNSKETARMSQVDAAWRRWNECGKRGMMAAKAVAWSMLHNVAQDQEQGFF